MISASELLRAVEFLRKGDWQAAHEIVQEDEESPLACWAHGIVHIMEGDLPNARYWYARARRSLPPDPVATEEIAALGSKIGL